MRMGSLQSRFFGAFEGTRSAYPIAIFRIAFFGGLALHFFPSLLNPDDNYTPGALRGDEWNHWLYAQVQHLPHTTMRAWSILTMAACGMAMVGFMSRFAVTVTGFGLYAFASFNWLPVQTIALVTTWAILLAWMICGGGAEVLSVDSMLSRSKRQAKRDAPKLLSGLVLFQVLLAVFFSGVEKLLAGWPWTNEMGIVLSYPRGFIVRDWVASSEVMRSSVVTHSFTYLTLVVELGCPCVLMLGQPRARIAALVVFQAFFLGIIAMLEVPPLFYFIFAFGALLALDDQQVAWVAARLTRSQPGARA
jgi:hypothetical protein